MLPKTLEILYFLMTTRSSSKIIHAAFTGDFSKKQFSTKLSKLKQLGYIEVDDVGVFTITNQGKEFIHRKTKYKYFDSPFTEKSKKDLLIIFDVPEKERSKRDWLRYQLKQFHFEQIQQSVWHGPSPLPKSFMKYLEELKIRDNIKLFKTNGKI